MLLMMLMMMPVVKGGGQAYSTHSRLCRWIPKSWRHFRVGLPAGHPCDSWRDTGAIPRSHCGFGVTSSLYWQGGILVLHTQNTAVLKGKLQEHSLESTVRICQKQRLHYSLIPTGPVECEQFPVFFYFSFFFSSPFWPLLPFHRRSDLCSRLRLRGGVVWVGDGGRQ